MSSNNNKNNHSNFFNLKNMGEKFTSGLNQASQKSKELMNKVKDAEIVKKAAESTKKSAESIKKGANTIWNETKAKTNTLSHNVQKGIQKSQSPVQNEPDVFDSYNNPDVILNQNQSTVEVPAAAEPEEDLFDMSAPAIVTEAPAPAAAEPEEDLFDMSASAIVTEAPAVAAAEPEEDLFDMSAAAVVTEAPAATEPEEDLFDMSAAAVVTEAPAAEVPAAVESEESLFDMPVADASSQSPFLDLSASAPEATNTNQLDDVFSSVPTEQTTSVSDAFDSFNQTTEPEHNEEDVFGDMNQPTIEKSGIAKFDDAFAGLSDDVNTSTLSPSMGMFDMDMKAPVQYEEPKKLSFAELQALNSKPVVKEEPTNDMGFDMNFGSSSEQTTATTSSPSNELDFMF